MRHTVCEYTEGTVPIKSDPSRDGKSEVVLLVIVGRNETILCCVQHLTKMYVTNKVLNVCEFIFLCILNLLSHFFRLIRWMGLCRHYYYSSGIYKISTRK